MDGSGSPDGYPCRDQYGASGNNPQVGGGQPYLLWNNTLNGSSLHTHADAQTYIAQNRDWCYATTCSGTSCNYTCGSRTVNYKAYTYPHPLTQGVVPENSSPAAPQGLQIIN